MCERILVCSGIAIGYVFKSNFIESVCFCFNRLAVLKFEQFGIFKTFTNRRNVKRLRVKRIKAAENTRYPSCKSTYCAEEQKELRHAEFVANYKTDKVGVCNCIAKERKYKVNDSRPKINALRFALKCRVSYHTLFVEFVDPRTQTKNANIFGNVQTT